MKNIVLLSSSRIAADGRTRSLYEILRSLGEVFPITPEEIFGSSSDAASYGFKDYVNGAVGMASRIPRIDILFVDGRQATVPGLRVAHERDPGLVIYDARELYLKKDSSSIQSFIGTVIEQAMIRKADHVIAANAERKRIMEEIYRLKNPVLVFENFRSISYSSDSAKAQATRDFARIFDEDPKYTIISTAGCSSERLAPELVSAFSKLDFDARLILVGCEEGPERDAIVRDLDPAESHDLVLLPRVDQDVLKYLLSRSDLGVAQYHKKNLNNLYCSSGKVYEYLYEGLPIATTDNVTLAQVTERYDVGVSDSDIGWAIRRVYENRSHHEARVQEFLELGVVEKGQHEFRDQLGHIISGGSDA